MRFYASLYKTRLHAAKDWLIPVGTHMSNNLQDAMIWFLEHRPKRREVPVILVIDLKCIPSGNSVNAYSRAPDGSVTFRTRSRMGTLLGRDRILPSEEDFLVVRTELAITSDQGNRIVVGLNRMMAPGSTLSIGDKRYAVIAAYDGFEHLLEEI